LLFYKRYEPNPKIGYFEIEQRIFCIAGAIRENRQLGPGAVVFRHGYVAFAATTSGGAYCFDTNVRTEDGKHPIVLFSHEEIDPSTDLKSIEASRVELASSLDDFLFQFSVGTLKEIGDV
jgi:hypothetical protein